MGTCQLRVLPNKLKICKTQLASIISAEKLRECQDFINKVSETRFITVRQRQLNKFNILINKKQGNQTRANATIWSNNIGPQSGRQASACPPGEGNNATQTNSQAGTPLPSREVSSPSQAITLVNSQESGIPPQLYSGHGSPSFQGRKQLSPSSCSPSLRGRKQFLPGNCSPSFQGKEAIPPRPLLSFLPVKETVFPRPLTLPRQGKSIILLVQSGRATGAP